MLETNKNTDLIEIFLIYLRLGCLRLGGLIAHFTNIKSHLANRSEQ